ncbi:MAG: dihydroorotate dehydrogenase electron transfer subunit [Candidatus Korarchaeum sp.]|nr:dihydroorotate dehydrogenase electron transfer subunit [Candidatus Korarchaeum sp.]MDW8035844.1 dihydroorotate dehydrogenase electron transfer subunit [Candidatus Korarchaeum sp.]
MNSCQAYEVMEVIETERLSDRVKKIVLNGNLNSSPGQYVMIWVPGVGEIPISIARELRGEIWLLVARVGKVSSSLHSMRAGDLLWLRGPYGRGFSLAEGRASLVGGGYGISPLIFLAERLRALGNVELKFYAGFRSEEEVLLENLLRSISDELVITTEDGSKGLRGKVVEHVDFEWPDRVYAAGPEAMIVQVVREALRMGKYVEASLERLIRCSLGVCGSCSLDPLGLLVCSDGPVFDGSTLTVINDFGRYWRDFDGRRISLGELSH